MPVAGGKPPLWQVEHWLVTLCWVWFHLVGFQEVVLWQLTQLSVVGICWVFLPEAAEPLWQEEHTVALVKRLWSTLAEAQLLVDLWQFSQVVWPLWMAVAGLAVRPKLELMWQVAHWVDSDTLECSFEGVQLE